MSLIRIRSRSRKDHTVSKLACTGRRSARLRIRERCVDRGEIEATLRVKAGGTKTSTAAHCVARCLVNGIGEAVHVEAVATHDGSTAAGVGWDLLKVHDDGRDVCVAVERVGEEIERRQHMPVARGAAELDLLVVVRPVLLAVGGQRGKL